MRPVQNLLPTARAVCRTSEFPEPRNLSLREFASIDLQDLRPLNGIPSWIGKQSYEGRWWFSHTGEHIAFASGWERDVITVLDFVGITAALQRDAVMILQPRVPATPPRPQIQPWLYVESFDRERILMLSRSDGDRAHELEAILSETQVAVTVPTLPSDAEMQGIRWLAGYRFSRFRLPPEYELIIREECAAVRSLGSAVRACAAAGGISQAVARANIYSQLWRGLLKLVEVRRPLDDQTQVVAA